MTKASNIAHDLLQRHAATPDHQLALPVDPAAIARAEGVDMPPVWDAYGRWDSAVAPLASAGRQQPRRQTRRAQIRAGGPQGDA